jgi:hypothetical protein
LGEAFVLRDFHDQFLSLGRLPMSLLRWEMTGLDDEVRQFWQRAAIPEDEPAQAATLRRGGPSNGSGDDAVAAESLGLVKAGVGVSE